MKKTPMILQKLEIEKESFGRNSGKFTGKARFSSDNATVYINVTPEISQKILELCADTLMESAHQMSIVMRGDIIEALPTEGRKRIK